MVRSANRPSLTRPPLNSSVGLCLAIFCFLDFHSVNGSSTFWSLCIVVPFVLRYFAILDSRDEVIQSTGTRLAGHHSVNGG